MNSINLSIEKAWITFMCEDWEVVWHPILDDFGNHLDWDSNLIMEICRNRFSHRTFGIAMTSQMIMRNAQRDNL